MTPTLDVIDNQLPEIAAARRLVIVRKGTFTTSRLNVFETRLCRIAQMRGLDFMYINRLWGVDRARARRLVATVPFVLVHGRWSDEMEYLLVGRTSPHRITRWLGVGADQEGKTISLHRTPTWTAANAAEREFDPDVLSARRLWRQFVS